MGKAVSLYFDLEDGQKADIEVIARTAIAFSEAVKELAFITDPSLEIRIELASGDEGSLSLNAVFRFLNGDGKDRRIVLWVLIGTVAGWLTADVRSYLVGKGLDYVLESPNEEFSPEEINVLRKLIDEQLQRDIANPKVQEIFQEVERDPAIKGIGFSPTPGRRPEHIIPRDAFYARAGYEEETLEIETRKRTRKSREKVSLVSPVLLPEDRKWKFSFHEGQFGAKISDEDFTRRFLLGEAGIPLSVGIEMDVLLETKEEFNDGVWRVKERRVLKVFDIRRVPTQTSIIFPERANEEQRSYDQDGRGNSPANEPPE